METLNNKKSKKGMISRIIFGLIIISSWAVLGVALAISSAKLNVGGGITFTATNVYADVDGVLNGTANDKSLSTISFNADTKAPFTTPNDWTNIDFSFGDGNYEISLTITITNRSAERAVYLAFEDNIEADNLEITRKHKKKNDADYTIVDSFSNMTIEKNTQDNPQMLQISMKVKDPNLSVKNGTFSLNINLSSEEVKQASEYQTLSFTQNSDGTMSVSKNEGNLPTGDLVIPAQVKYNGKICDVTEISGFNDCSISAINIPSTVTSLNLNYVYSLKNLEVNESNSVFYSYENGIYRRSDDALVCGCQNTIIKEGTKTIAKEAFKGKTGMGDLVIPDSVTKIEDMAFVEMFGLTSLKLSNNLTYIGSAVFWHTSGLTSITIPASVTYMNAHTFEYCTNLKTIYIESEYVANMITSENSTYLFNNATTIYLANNCSATDYIQSNFTQTTSDQSGYVKWVKNS